MRLKNKATGEINIIKADEDYFNVYQDDGDFVCPVTLKELNDGWEDAPEEPKGYWFIDCAAPYPVDFCKFNEDTEDDKAIGNYFESKEEAEKAVEKLKAWKQLKDICNFRFNGLERDVRGRLIGVKVKFDETQGTFDTAKRCCDILYMLFGGEDGE